MVGLNDTSADSLCETNSSRRPNFIKREALHLSDSALSLCLLAFSGGGLVGMPAAGLLVAGIGSQRATIGLALTFAVGMALPGFTTSLPLLIAAAFLFGMGKGFLDVAMNTYAAAVQRGWGVAIMSSFHAAFSVGGLVGAVTMGALFGYGFDVRAGLLLMAISALPLIGMAAFLVRGAAIEDGGGNQSPAFAWPSRALLGIGCLCFLALLTEGGMADWSGVYMATVIGVSTAGAAAGYAAFSVTMIVGRLSGDWIVHRWGERTVLRPEGAAAAMGATVGYAGFLLGPPMIGFAADHVGLRLALGMLLLAAIVIAGFGGRVITEQGRR